MELHQIKSFVTVARTGNLTRAAQMLHTTPPSVSAHIRQLEELSGLSLFFRTPRGMALTGAGKELLPRAAAVLDAAMDFSQAAMALSGQIFGRLRLGINADPAFLRIEPIVQSLFENHPGLCLEVVHSSTPEILQRLSQREMDMGYVFGEHDRCDLAFRFLARVDLEIVVPIAFEAEYRQAGWEEIARLPWIRPTTRCPLLDQVTLALTQRHLALSNPVTANDDITKNALINRGIAATVLVRSEARQMEKQGKVFIWSGHEPLFTRVSLAFSKARAGMADIEAMASTVTTVWQADEA